ncbi:hypothetical protein SLE2022_102900 [Rubroshorea leprosula]
MAVSKKEDGRWSEVKMEGDNGLRTVECLRGRLLAERQASRVAKEEAEFMGSKLVELKNRLREETKLRNRAEKRLKFLKKKLESLKILPVLEDSQQSSSSAFSCQTSVEESGSNPPEKPGENASETTKSAQTHECSSNEENAESHSRSESDTKDLSHENPKEISSNEDPKTDDNSDSSLRSSAEVIRTKDHINDDHVDDSLALVPVTPPEKNPSPEIKIVNKNVVEVLDNLRHIRERIQSTVESRRVMIRVGPA